MTYSILGRDPETGELGVAVQSQAFNTGAAVPWARPGVGAIATQSFTDRRYGFRGLELLAAGATPQAALDELRAPDTLAGFRQVGMMDAAGATAQWTGDDCIPHAGNAAGENWCAQGNMLAADAWNRDGRGVHVGDRVARAAADARRSTRRRRPAATGAAAAAPGSSSCRPKASRGSGSSTCASRRATTHSSSCGASSTGRRATGARTTRGPQRPGAAKDGLPEGYVRFLAMLDAAGQGDVAEGRRLLAEIVAEQPMWLEAFRRFARHPEMPPLGEILD